MKAILLSIDAAVNILLGLLLVVFPRSVASLIGVPDATVAFYPSILGAVLFGIGVALVLERSRSPFGGLGLGGAVSINVSGGVILAAWLVWGDLGIPLHGYLFLWLLVAVLLGLSGVELLSLKIRKRKELSPSGTDSV